MSPTFLFPHAGLLSAKINATVELMLLLLLLMLLKGSPLGMECSRARAFL